MGTPVASAQTRPAVLVVDDEEQVRDYMARILSEAGCSVLVAHDGLEAWGMLDSYAGAVHLVVTDVSMPRLGGAELAAHVRQRWPDLPILYVTGRPLPQDAPDAPVLNKPFLPHALIAQVMALLGPLASA